MEISRNSIYTKAKTHNVPDSNEKAEFYLVIQDMKSGKIYHHCEFTRDNHIVAIVACRHFNYTFGEMRQVSEVIKFCETKVQISVGLKIRRPQQRHVSRRSGIRYIKCSELINQNEIRN